MTFVRAYCRNGDVHIGHMTAWADGSAVIGGTRIDGVVFIDAHNHPNNGARVPLQLPQAGWSSTAAPTETCGRPSTGGESQQRRGEPGDGGALPVVTTTSTTNREAPAQRELPGA